MSSMEGLEWRRHMLGAKEIVRQKTICGLAKGQDTPFISAFMAQWEAYTAVTTGETPLLDFLIVYPQFLLISGKQHPPTTRKRSSLPHNPQIRRRKSRIHPRRPNKRLPKTHHPYPKPHRKTSPSKSYSSCPRLQ
jgi:hypothetical protein